MVSVESLSSRSTRDPSRERRLPVGDFKLAQDCLSALVRVRPMNSTLSFSSEDPANLPLDFQASTSTTRSLWRF